jgi:tRNA threonylcarbamoyladenosine modification (KEOPS) complex  Pcc1 subunit
MSIEKGSLKLEVEFDSEEIAEIVRRSISPDDEPEGKKVRAKTYKEGKRIVIEISAENQEVLTLKNTAEEYLRSIATVINALSATENEPEGEVKKDEGEI